MAYIASKIAQQVNKAYIKKGKVNALTPPSYKPPGQVLFDYISVIFVLLAILSYFFLGIGIVILFLSLALIIFSIRELFIQDDHTLIRIYGPLGRMRYFFEDAFRDKYLQYFNETNKSGRPIPKIVRDYIYQKSKGVKALTGFGTELDIYDPENTTNTRILHRNFPGEIPEVSYGYYIGEGKDGVKPFFVKNTINISGMSYGSLNYKACESISLGAKDVAYVATGEGGYGPHGVAGNDVVFQIGTGKFGAGKDITINGKPHRILDEQLLVETIKNNENIRMIQLKISQGAKPGIGGHLPGVKNTPEIAEVRKVKPWTTLVSPSEHAEIIAKTPAETISKLIQFIKHIRKLTCLPVGIKLCVGKLEEIDLLVEAMKQTGDGPDAIQVDGADGGTGAGPNLFVNYVGYGGCVETLAYLNGKLKQAGIRDKVKLSASGKLFTPVHAALAFAHGADTIDTARAAMLAIGCIQALKCHTDQCPTGIATHNKWRMHGIAIPEKSTRVHSYLVGFNHDMLEITKVLGHSDPRDIKPSDLRIITNKNNFAKFFETDPFGMFLPTPEKLQEN